MTRDSAASLRTRDSITTGKSSAAPADVATAVLTEAEYELFAELGRPRRVEAGQLLFRRGELGTTMFVIARGVVDLDFGDDLVGKRLGPSEFFGELGLLIGDHVRSADAVAASDGLLIELRHEEFQRLVDRDPGLVSYFLRRAILRVVLNEQSLIRRLRRRNEELQSALDSLYTATHQLNQTEELVRTDELTRLYNRRGLTLHLQEHRDIGTQRSMGLLLVDCDRFKQVNDDHGHLIGDRVLQGVANILRSVAGPDDFACRLGGDGRRVLPAGGQRPARGGDALRRLHRLHRAGPDADVPRYAADVPPERRRLPDRPHARLDTRIRPRRCCALPGQAPGRQSRALARHGTYFGLSRTERAGRDE